MGGTLDLPELLKEMQPELDEKSSYVFLPIPHELMKDNAAVLGTLVADHAIATFREAEGLTVVVESGFVLEHILAPPSKATFLGEPLQLYWKTFTKNESLPPMSHITMRIHSSLSAVGFTAAFSRALTDAGISCNVFAGFYHDHIFVPEGAKAAAMTTLTALSKKKPTSVAETPIHT